MNTECREPLKVLCVGCGWPLIEWFPGNLVCTCCGYDDSRPLTPAHLDRWLESERSSPAYVTELMLRIAP